MLFLCKSKSFCAQFAALFHHALQFKPIIMFSLFITAVTLVFAGGPTAIEPAEASSTPQDSLNRVDAVLPSEYGEVIYRINEDSPKQLYIIGISHRSPESGKNNDDTVRTQAEIFRIGEWLNRNNGLELLLPEGYFGSRKDFNASDAFSAGLDTVRLHEELADESRFINAEMLLLEHYDMRASQVENRKIYDAVLSSLEKLRKDDLDLSSEAKLDELHFLQDVRTAMLLQNIPDVIENELVNGTIRRSSAMFTIGLNHVQDIIRYLDENPVNINVPEAVTSEIEDYRAELDLIKKGYGITIIIPRTLADNARLLQVMNLDRIQVAQGDTAAVVH